MKNIHTSIYTYAYTHRGVTMKAELIEKKADLRRLSPELFESWVSFIDVKEGSIATYKRAIKRFSLYLIATNQLEPTRETIIQYREHLKTQLKATTVQNYMEAVKLFFRWTNQEDIYPNIADHVKGVRIDPDFKRDYLTEKQAAALLESINTDTEAGLRDYAMLSLMITTGLRTISIASANLEDVRPAGNDIVLYYQGKGHEERAKYVKIAPPVLEAINAYLMIRKSRKGKEPLFASFAPRNPGERLTTRSISRIVKDRLRGAGMDSERLTAHSLRHTAATLNLMNGGTLEETKQLLDHESINTTLIYSHALERANNQSESRIASCIFPKQKRPSYTYTHTHKRTHKEVYA